MGQSFPGLDISYWNSKVKIEDYGGRKPVDSQAVDVAEHMTGGLVDGENGPLYELRTLFYDQGTGSYDTPGPQQRHQTQARGGVFYFTKDRDWEQFWLAEHQGEMWVWRGWDTSQSDTEMYAQRDPETGKVGAPWCPAKMTVNKYYRRSPLVTHHSKDNCAETSRGVVPSFIVCRGVVRISTPAGTVPAVELEWAFNEGGEALETYYFSKQPRIRGLAGFWTPKTRMTEVSELHEPGQRPDNERWELPGGCA